MNLHRIVAETADPNCTGGRFLWNCTGGRFLCAIQMLYNGSEAYHTQQAFPYRISQADVQKIYNDAANNYIVLDHTGVIKESDSAWISQVTILTVDADNFDISKPVNLVSD